MDGRTIRVSSLGHTDTQTHNTQTHRLPMCVSASVNVSVNVSASISVSVSVSVSNMCMCICMYMFMSPLTTLHKYPSSFYMKSIFPAPRISGLYYLLPCFPIFYVCIYKYIHIHRALLLLSYLIQKISAYHPEKYVYDLTTLSNRSKIYV